MRVKDLSSIDQRKATVFMDENTEMQADKEKAIMAIVHEIRNPLTAIKLTNQLMQEAFERNEKDMLLMQSYASMVEKNIARIEKHLTEVLAYRKKELELTPVNICDCIDKGLCEAKDRLFLANIQVSKNYKGSHWVFGNEEKLVTAFLNIIINAIEAIKKEDGKIWISVYHTNNSVRITFKDNGIGMSATTVGKIFDPKFSTKDGIGIGMSNVKEIMNLHKASIIADSLPDVGTSISILFSSIPEERTPTMPERSSGSVSGNH